MEARLPFKQDPVVALPDNRFQAEKMLQSQLRSIAKRPGCREDVFRAHNKLRDKGHVIALKDLPPDIKEIVDKSPGRYYIPWSVVYKLGSLSSPSRVVFNASMKTRSGFSLNSILAKGVNKLPRILHLLNEFGLRRAAFCGDISMAYNAVKLLPEFITFQRYLWAEELNINDPVVEMVVVTLIYGVTPSGGLMTAGFESTADYAIKHHPDHAKGANVIKRSSYVDDIIRSCYNLEECHELAKSVDFCLKLAGMETKGFTFSGSDPPDTVSADGMSVGVLGYVWWPKEDYISLANKELCLGKSSRGRAATPVTGDLKSTLAPVFTRRVLSGKVCGIYDPKGLVTPITSRIKLHLSEIVDLKIGWDDIIPGKYLDTWVQIIQDIQKLSNLRFPRCYLHPESINDQVELIVSVDASKDVAVAAVHARTELPDGNFGCRLICAKSKLVHLSTIPRGELRAAVLGATLAHIVRQNIGAQFSKVYFVTDSTIVMAWLNHDQRPLQTLVRNAVIEVRRLSSIADWYHVDSANNLADLGTRECGLAELDSSSAWQNGLPWMNLPRHLMPIKSMAEVMLSQAEKREASKEVKGQETVSYALTELKDKVKERYKYSKYLVDPCARPWPTSVRILAIVLKFIKLCSRPRNKRNFSEISAPTENPASSDASPAPLISESDSDGTPPAPNDEGFPKNVNLDSFLTLLRPDAKVFKPSPRPDDNIIISRAVKSENLTSIAHASGCNTSQSLEPETPSTPSCVCMQTGKVVPLPVPATTARERRQAPTDRFYANSQTESLEPESPVSFLSASMQSNVIPEKLRVIVKPKNTICLQVTNEEVSEAEHYFFRKATQEVMFFSNKRDYEHATKQVNGILFYKGRILDGQEVDDVENIMDDLQPLTFFRPVADRYSPVSYSVMHHVHSRTVHHRNAATSLLQSRSIIYILQGRDLSNEIRNACTYCRRFKAKLLEVELGNVHGSRFRVANAFLSIQVDMFGPYDARCEHQPHRATVSVWGVIFKCPASGAISVCAMSKSDTEAFILAYGRHAYRYGHPIHMYVDQGSQIMKACRQMEWSWADITHTLNSKHGVGVQHTIAPVLGHNQIGMVERSVREVKKLFNLIFAGLKLDSLAYETAFQYIANELNNLPMCLGSRYTDLDHADLITPSRLILGRNNRRAPTGYARVDQDKGYSKNKSKQIKDLDSVHKAWWKVWQQERLADYIPRPRKWIKTTRVPEVDDVVIYLERDKDVTLGKTLWKLGKVIKTILDKDTGIRNVCIGYKNYKEKTWRETWRTARKMAIIFREGDLEIVDELNKAAKEATVSMNARIISGWSCRSTFCTHECIDSQRHDPGVDIAEE